MIFMKWIDDDKKVELIDVMCLVTDDMGLSGGYVNEDRHNVTLDNELVKNKTIYKENFLQATITNTTFRNCTFFCVGTYLDTVFQNCTFENCRFINCTMDDTYLENVAFFNCNMFDSIISAIHSKIASVWRIGCKISYKQFKGYEELFL